LGGVPSSGGTRKSILERSSSSSSLDTEEEEEEEEEQPQSVCERAVCKERNAVPTPVHCCIPEDEHDCFASVS
jgi:hypothetical protein